MKKQFRYGLAAAICLCANLLNAQTLQTYSGKYEGGEVAYTYKTASDGERIYEGDFRYTNDSVRITGRYKNNMKDGLWMYDTGKGKLEVYYKGGKLDGPYRFEGEMPGLMDVFSDRDTSRYELSFMMKANRVIGDASVKNDKNMFVGHFDEGGYADGEWIYNRSWRTFRCLYKNGHLQSFSYTNSGTGKTDTLVYNNLTHIVPNKIIHLRDHLESLAKHGWIPFESYPSTLEQEMPENTIYWQTEEMPQYPGGTEKMNEFIRKELRKRVPKDINGGCGVPGRTVMWFVVNKDGSISDIEILRSLDPLWDKEAVRVVRKMPKWIPGKCEVKPVRTRFALAVAFHNL